MSEANAPVPQVRASDAERDRTAEAVRRAVGDGRLTLVEGDERLAGVYGATYRGELATFVADLDAPTPDPPTEIDVPERSTSIAVMSGVRRGEVWAPGATHRVVTFMGGAELAFAQARLDPTGVTVDVVAFMGGAQIDLRGAPIGPGGLTVRVVAIMGGVEVIVDPRTRMVENGFGLMGAFADEAGPPTEAGGPAVRVTGFALMGGVAVHRRAPGDRELER